jgi:nicotinamide mononucleotide (NMN) deamidase PncC
MFVEEVAPRLRSKVGERHVVRQILKVIGLGEPLLDARIAPIYKQVENPRVGLLFSPLDVEVHLTASASSEAEALALNEALARPIQEALGMHVYGQGDVSLAKVVGQLLLDRGEKLAIIDVATGGLTIQRLSEVPGSEKFLSAALVCSRMEQAQEWLGLAGSGELNILQALRDKTGAQHALAVLSDPLGEETRAQNFTFIFASELPGDKQVDVVFPGDSEIRRSRAAQGALDLVRRRILLSGVTK